MLGIRLLCVGRMKEKYFMEALAEYEKRLGRYCGFSVTELPETGDIRRDGAGLLAKLSPGETVIALCVEGESLSSQGLADILRESALSGRSRLCFLIGGSDGLSAEVKARAERRISMSAMTFPHHLARVMLAEQLYRACTINEGGRYHK